MNYIITTLSEREFYHSGINDSRKDHKYVARVENPKSSVNKYRYFYDLLEWNAYLGKTTKNAKKVITKISKKTNGSVKKGYDVVKKIIDNATTKTPNNSVRTLPKAFDKLKKINPSSMSNDEHQAVINPNYDPESYGYSMNCASCSVAYDLRKRGYDVEAAPFPEDLSDDSPERPSYININDLWYDPPVDFLVSEGLTKVSRKQEFNEIANDMPDGSWGMIGVNYDGGGGHSLAWEKENGKVVIRDCQDNTIVDLDMLILTTEKFYFGRTDDKVPTEVVLSKVRNRK